MINRRLFLSSASTCLFGVTTFSSAWAKSTFSMTEYVRELRELVAIDSKSGYVQGVNRIADIFEKRFHSIGWTVTRHDSKGKGDILLASNTPNQSQFDVLISAHSDTVQPVGHAQKYPLRIEDNMAYGAGVADDKSSLNAAWWVVKTLPESVSQKIRIGFVINPAEESGNATIGEFLRDLGKKTPAVLVFEPGRDGNGCVMERKGAMWLTLIFKGLSAHAGNNPKDGRNAIEAMCLAVPQIKAIESRYPDVTLNADVVEGGTAVNVIADRAVVKFDFRFFNDQSRDRVLADIDALCKKGFAPGVSVEMKGGRSSAMSLTSASRALRDLVNEAARAAGQSEPKWLRVGGASDGNQFSGAGAAVVCGMGVVGGNLHNVEKEWSDLSTVFPRIQLNQSVLQLIAQRKL